MEVKAQREGYIVKDTTYMQGYLNYSAENLDADSVGFSKTRRSIFTYYTVDELSEYSLNGKTFFSKEVENRNRFLRQLAEGNTNLYLTQLEGKRRYFIESDSQLSGIKKEEYQDKLKSSLGSCGEVNELVELVRYRKNDMARIVNYCNGNSIHFFPYRRIGVILGNSSRFLRIRYRGFNPRLERFTGPVFGLFVDNPIEVYSKWSTRIELTFINHDFSLHEENAYVLRDYTISLTTVNMPIMVRYRAYGTDLVTFYNFGFVLGYNARADINLFEVSNDMGLITEKEYQLDIIDKKDFGLVGGVGVDFLINHKRTLGLEIRYQFNFGGEGRIDHTINDLQLLASINF